MKKLFLSIVLFTFILVSCSSKDATEETNEVNINGSEENVSEELSVEANHPEVLFSHEFDEDDRYDFTGIHASIDGNTILFKTQEEIKRDSQRYEFIIIGDEEAKNIKEISEASDEDLDGRRCSRTFVSPDGRYLTYSCARAENWFVVYDTNEDLVVHHQEELDDRSLDIAGITNNMEVILESHDGNKIAILDLETEDMKEFSIPELSGIEDDHFTDLVVADDGKKIFITNQLQISVLDTERGTLEEVMNVDPYVERFKDETDSISVGTLRVSPNGKYLFYFLGGSKNRETVYQSINFVNIETGETKSYTNHEYHNFRSIDNSGNMLLGDNEQMYLYNIDRDTIYHIPNIKIGVYTEYITLTGDGKHVFYADRTRDSNDQPVYELFHLAIEEIDTYEVVDFKATPEDTETLLGETAITNDNKDSNQDGVVFTPVNDDIRQLMEEKWEETASIRYPTIFPEEVSEIYDTVRQDSFSQTIRLDPAEHLTQRRELVYTVNSYPDRDRKDFCIHDDLELEKTVDGVDYYFYLFNNGDVELAFVEDDLCYELKGDNFTKDEMFDVIDSIETQGTRPEELPIADIKFPSQLPHENTEIRRFHASKQGSNYAYFAAYYGDENELDLTYRVTLNEPREFDLDGNVAVEVNDASEAYFNEASLRLVAFDGDYYYIIEADAKNEVRDAVGGEENIKEALIEIMNSLE